MNALATAPSDAFAVRRQHFPDEINFHAPGLKRYRTSAFVQTNPRAWLPISLTGDACALQCDHCAAKVLLPMISVLAGKNLYELCAELQQTGTKGVLVSGGSMKNGQVPLLKHVEHMRKIKDELGMKLICHTGLVSEDFSVWLTGSSMKQFMASVEFQLLTGAYFTLGGGEEKTVHGPMADIQAFRVSNMN